MRAATRWSKLSRCVRMSSRCTAQASTGEKPPGALIDAISTSSFNGTSTRRAPAADRRVRAREKAALTVASRASSTRVCGMARRTPSSGRGTASSGLPESTPSTVRQSSTQTAMAHTVSSVCDKGKAPVIGTRDCVFLKPTMPHSAAGMRMEPPVSEPRPATHRPAATDTAAPEEEPPGMRATCGSAGLAGVPKCGLAPTPENANSLMFVLPSTAAPAARKRATAGASAKAAERP